MQLTKKQRQALNISNLDLFASLVMHADKPAITPILPSEEELQGMFDLINIQYFEGKLPKARIEWSSRMRIAGKCYIGHKIIKLGRKYHEFFPEDLEDTLKHEMLHLLYPDHGREFKREAKRIGTTQYAREYPGGKSPHKYIYVCPNCGQKYYRHRRMYNVSCGSCSMGGYDERYKLKLYWSAKSSRRKS